MQVNPRILPRRPRGPRTGYFALRTSLRTLAVASDSSLADMTVPVAEAVASAMLPEDFTTRCSTMPTALTSPQMQVLTSVRWLAGFGVTLKQ